VGGAQDRDGQGCIDSLPTHSVESPPITPSLACWLKPRVTLQGRGRGAHLRISALATPFLWALHGGQDKQRNWPCL
jgi:hypothetical protein